ncbi:hypothetical protein Vafri_9501 [Volvox africanus]|uniref:tRNA-uridine aminocarboxypropyltransferase n=1 Tax=Volvox africanus TaxID=51714 RepID=A0A8J4F1I8_9CHLO|nr:hypothetical protein Vafri_9501 [Volvox africanus]
MEQRKETGHCPNRRNERRMSRIASYHKINVSAFELKSKIKPMIMKAIIDGQATTNQQQLKESGRPTCDRCKRPRRVCLCTVLPVRPMRLLGRILILQHPHELKKRLATVPLLKCCLDDESLTVVTGRKLQPGSNAVVDALLDGAERGTYPLYVLFPGPGSQDLAKLAEDPMHGIALLRAASRKTAEGSPPSSSISLLTPTVSSATAPTATAPTATAPTATAPTATATAPTATATAPTATAPTATAPATAPPTIATATAPKTTTADATVAQAGVEEAAPIKLPASELAPLNTTGSPLTGPQRQEQHLWFQRQELQLLDSTEAADPGGRLGPGFARFSERALETSVPGTASRVPIRCTSDTATPNSVQAPAGAGDAGTAPEPLTEAVVTAQDRKTAADVSGGEECHSQETQLPPPAYLLLVIDGTWRQAREMYRVVAPRCLPPGAPGIQVALKPSDVLPASIRLQKHRHQQCDAARQQEPQKAECEPAGTAEAEGGNTGVSPPDDDNSGLEPAASYDPEMPCLIRKEPMEGFVTTYEATARAIGLLERDTALGTELLAPLRLMTRLQAAFSPSILSRMRAEPEPQRS